MFVCGLSPTFGGPTVSSKIDSNQLNSAKMCPLLNRWAFSVQTMDSNMLAACIATADVEQSLFQMKCCAEMFIGSATDGPGFSNFPGGRHEFRFPATCDFLQIPLEIMPFMIHDKFISFKPKSIAFQVRNMIVTESNINKFREVSKFIMNTDSYYFINEMSNIKCDHQVDHVDHWLTNLSVLLCCNLVNVSLCKKDMSILMEQLGSCIQIRSLIMHQVSSENLHRELPRHLPKFSRLNDLVLSAIEVPTGQEILCQAVGKLKLLSSLALCQMDLSEAGNALGATVECLSGLDCLDLHKSNLTEQQVVQVAQAIRKNCAYISNLDLSDNSAVGNSYQAVCECIKHLDFLLTIGVQNCQMTFHGLWQTLQSLPTSIVFIFAAGIEVDKDSTETMDFFLKQHPNIKYISLGVKEMNANNREFIKNMFDEVNAQAFLVKNENEHFCSDLLKKAFNISQHIDLGFSFHTSCDHGHSYNCMCKGFQRPWMLHPRLPYLCLFCFIMMLIYPWVECFQPNDTSYLSQFMQHIQNCFASTNYTKDYETYFRKCCTYTTQETLIWLCGLFTVWIIFGL